MIYVVPLSRSISLQTLTPLSTQFGLGGGGGEKKHKKYIYKKVWNGVGRSDGWKGSGVRGGVGRFGGKGGGESRGGGVGGRIYANVCVCGSVGIMQHWN